MWGGGTGGSSGACKGMRKREIAGEQDCVYVGGGQQSSEACKGVGKQGNCRGAGLHVGGGLRLGGGIS